MLAGSWPKAQGSWLKAQANKEISAKAWDLRDPAASFFLAMIHEPWATSLEAWVLSHETLTIKSIK